MNRIEGINEARARLKALRKNVFKPAAKDWAQEAAAIARRDIAAMSMPYSKRVLLPSITPKLTRTGNIAQSGTTARVVASYHAYFVDAGTKPHSLGRRKARNTIFAPKARKHPGYRARPFRAKATVEAYRRHPAARYVIEAWNRAA